MAFGGGFAVGCFAFGCCSTGPCGVGGLFSLGLALALVVWGLQIRRVGIPKGENSPWSCLYGPPGIRSISSAVGVVRIAISQVCPWVRVMVPVVPGGIPCRSVSFLSAIAACPALLASAGLGCVTRKLHWCGTCDLCLCHLDGAVRDQWHCGGLV